jgi:hypothetical protein
MRIAAVTKIEGKDIIVIVTNDGGIWRITVNCDKRFVIECIQPDNRELIDAYPR